jgi:hypothetical protein
MKTNLLRIVIPAGLSDSGCALRQLATSRIETQSGCCCGRAVELDFGGQRAVSEAASVYSAKAGETLKTVLGNGRSHVQPIGFDCVVVDVPVAANSAVYRAAKTLSGKSVACGVRWIDDTVKRCACTVPGSPYFGCDVTKTEPRGVASVRLGAGDEQAAVTVL